MPPRLLACLALLLGAAACFSPEFPDGQVPCGSAGECPGDLECRAGLCFKIGVTPSVDGGIDSSLGPDASLPAVDAFVPPHPDADPNDAEDPGDSMPPVDAMRFDAGPMGTIMVVFKGDGGGSVTLNGVTCDSDCTRSFPLGTVVDVTPMPEPTSLFAGWGGSCSGTAACQVTVDSAGKTVEVTFNQSTQQRQLQVIIQGPGSVNVSPQGTSCGPACFVHPMGTPVTLMPQPTPGFSFIGWTGANCEVVGAMPCVFALNNNVTVVARFCDFHRVVDATSGLDTGPGTCASPYKTITKALSVAAPNDRVLVRPGLYQPTTDEVFPLVVPDNVSLIGDEPTKGNGTSAVRLEGGGVVAQEPGLRAAVVLGTGSVLAGFLVIDPPGLPKAHGVVISKPTGAIGAVVRNNTIANGGGDGIYINKGPNAVIRGNVVSNQDLGTGIWITDGGAGAMLEENVVLSNLYGVEVDVTADLGGGNKGSMGGNVFSCNSENDLIVSGPTGATLVVSAKDNAWDHTPPGMGCASNVDLCAQNASVATDGATLAASSCP